MTTAYMRYAVLATAYTLARAQRTSVYSDYRVDARFAARRSGR